MPEIRKVQILLQGTLLLSNHEFSPVRFFFVESPFGSSLKRNTPVKILPLIGQIVPGLSPTINEVIEDLQ